MRIHPSDLSPEFVRWFREDKDAKAASLVPGGYPDFVAMICGCSIYADTKELAHGIERGFVR